DRQEQIGGRWAVQADGAIHLVSDQAIVIEAPDVTLKGAGGFVRVGADGGTTHGGWPGVQAGWAGAGAGSDPATPELPGGGAQPIEQPRVRRLPLLGFPSLPAAPGVDSERLVICEAICSCKDVRASSPGKGPRPSDCVTARL